MRRKDRGIYQLWTWDQVYKEVKHLCLGLMSLGLRPEDAVAIIGENEPQLFWSHWATEAAGARAVCLYPDVIPREAHYIIDHSEAIFIVCDDQEQVDKVLEIKHGLPRIQKIIYWDPRGMWKYSDPILMTFEEVQELGRNYDKEHPGTFEACVSQRKGSDIAVISYTSGTTGNPKGVILTYNMILDSAHKAIVCWDVHPFMQYLSYLAPAWATEQYCGLAMGLILPMVINFSEEPETVLENIREVGSEMLVFGPRQWESLASTAQARLLDAGFLARFAYRLAVGVGEKVATIGGRFEEKPVNPFWRLLYPLAYLLVLRPLLDKLGLLKVRVPITGGSAMAPETLRLFNALGLPLRNCYGMTEIGFQVTHMGDRFDPETIGTLMPVHPDFGHQQEWRIDDSGGLLVRGGVPFQGYYKDPETTAKVKSRDWFITGDALSVREDGEMVYLERVKDLRSLSTGATFPPQFIESRLRFSPFIKDVMCLGDETRPFVAALVNIDADVTGRWAEQRAIAYSTFPDLSQKPEVVQLIQQEIGKVNQNLPKDANVRRFANLPKEFDPDEAELTRTRKLRRSFLEERYGKLIEAIYRQEAEYITEVPVKYRDGRVGEVTAVTKIADILEQAEAR